MLLLLVMIAVLLAGMLLDAISIYMILMPVLIPVMQHFGWNPVWFGILLAMNIAIGQFTPPVAVNLLVTTEAAKIRLEQTVGWAMLFVATMGLALLMVAVFPEIALWLPRVLGYELADAGCGGAAAASVGADLSASFSCRLRPTARE